MLSRDELVVIVGNYFYGNAIVFSKLRASSLVFAQLRIRPVSEREKKIVKFSVRTNSQIYYIRLCTPNINSVRAVLGQ